MKSRVLIITILLFIFSCKKDNSLAAVQINKSNNDSIKILHIPIDSKAINYGNKNGNDIFIYDSTFKKNKYNKSLSRIYGKFVFNNDIDLIFIERKPTDDEHVEPIITMYSYNKKYKIDSLDIYETVNSEAYLEKRFLIDKAKRINIYEKSKGYDKTNDGKDTLITERKESVFYISPKGKFILQPNHIIKKKLSITNNSTVWIGNYNIKTKAISDGDNKEFIIRYYISIDSSDKAILSIGAEHSEDYWCEGDYYLTKENNILHAKGKCDQDDTNDFYLKYENGEYYIKSKRFEDQDWQVLNKDK